MCLGIPGRVIDVRDDAALRMGRVDFGGVRKEVCLAYTPEVGLGDYVIVHVGFAISRVDEDEALKTLAILEQMGNLVDAELATMGPGMAEPAVIADEEAPSAARLDVSGAPPAVVGEASSSAPTAGRGGA